ncbi:complex I 24 kDa subunit family protein [Syntrophomonas wolfei]|uniref:NADH:ubiquinone oxidoreductase 24 kD subunit NuoE n=1 Tax=Syntrophomonas wolfei subsp. wolfei (strain DSM 2245B / Goettingen) TaxID=335541 RepID=Q0AWA4_SYNWW|nr:NAD(P)H-dependent oxidoreductase subunit E [Syntrophomonas wolfei]ABI69000.1 NADH:ubiquinone oxidoreductase 24 kD subunit NuoE [Syntrophomonas wolfei subsp. wolfei str. Goettingen G311]
MSEQEYEENIEGFRKIISGFPGEKRYIIAIMHELSRCYRYLPRSALELTAEYVGVPFSQVYSMATFYRAFSLQPRGRFNIKVCDGTTCHIKGSNILLDEIHKNLGIGPGETTADREFSLETVNCIGACAIAPALLVNERVYPRVNAAALKEIIKEYRGGGDNDHHE